MKCGKEICQNTTLREAPDICANTEMLVEAYVENPIANAIVFGGLDPMDTPKQAYQLVRDFRKLTEDDIVIYTGFTKEEILSIANLRKYYEKILQYKNIYFKFGRYIPGQEPHLDNVLGVKLASDNQYGEQVS